MSENGTCQFCDKDFSNNEVKVRIGKGNTCTDCYDILHMEYRELVCLAARDRLLAGMTQTDEVIEMRSELSRRMVGVMRHMESIGSDVHWLGSVMLVKVLTP